MTQEHLSKPTGQLQDTVAVICGGAGLIGKAMAEAVLMAGGTVVIADNDEAAGQQTVQSIQNAAPGGARAAFIHTDVTSKDSVTHLIGSAAEKYGKIDALVNAAYPRNANYGAKLEDVTYNDFCQNVNLHLGGYFLTAQQFALFFEKQGFGNIVNLSSIYGVVAPRFEIYDHTGMTMPVEYAVIKSGIIHLTRYLAAYYKGKGLRFNCISPGGIANRQPPAFVERYNAHTLSKGMLDAGDLCGTLLFLLSHDSRYVNGQNIIVDDGFTL